MILPTTTSAIREYLLDRTLGLFVARVPINRRSPKGARVNASMTMEAHVHMIQFALEMGRITRFLTRFSLLDFGYKGEMNG